MRKRCAVAFVAVPLSVVFAGCIQPPASPVASIPRLLVDYTNNTTVLYLSSSIGADVRYGNLTIVLHNDNLTQDTTFHTAHAFGLIARTNLTFFSIRASADEADSFYYYNATMQIVPAQGAPSGQPPQYQIFIRETADGPIQQAAIPYKHILAEGTR